MNKEWWEHTGVQALIVGLTFGVSLWVGLTAYNYARKISEGAGIIVGLVVTVGLAALALRRLQLLYRQQLETKYAAEAEHLKAKKLSAPEATEGN